MKKTSHGDEQLPQFDLITENELLKIKLKAEFGAECTQFNEELPPEVINEFLRSLYNFEQQFRGPRKFVNVYDRIGKPYFHKSRTLDDSQITEELKRLRRCMQTHGMQLDQKGKYPDREIYNFITEEFFRFQVEDISIPGYVQHFYYEDFHLNHDAEIQHKTTEFLSKWFTKVIKMENWPCSEVLTSNDGIILTKQEAMGRINQVYAAYKHFENCEYRMEELAIHCPDNMEGASASITGRLRFAALLESGERIKEHGPFKIEFRWENDEWRVCFFELPALSW